MYDFGILYYIDVYRYRSSKIRMVRHTALRARASEIPRI